MVLERALGIPGALLRRLPGLAARSHCPVCRSDVPRFEPAGIVLRPCARCPACGALERHRLIWYFLKEHARLLDGTPRTMLHVAPEEFFRIRMQQIHNLRYVTTDLLEPGVMVRVDLTAIPFADGTFDIVLCSHVLEHIPDDRQAIRELYRILRPGGFAILQVPITVDRTFEDPSVVDPAERLRLFGQEDHVRRYGPDYFDRLAESGFDVRRIPPDELAGPRGAALMGFMAGDDLAIGRKGLRGAAEVGAPERPAHTGRRGG